MTAGKSFQYPLVSFVVILMRNVALFVEDFAHQQVIGAILERLANEYSLKLDLLWRSAVRGFGRVVNEFERYVHDLETQVETTPDLIIVATDANCKGLQQRSRELRQENSRAPIIQAIPDPHIERWLLLDGAAFKAVFGKGCDAPDLKCDRNRYKQLLTEAIREAGINPSLGGIEFADDIVKDIDFKRASQSDDSFRKFIENIRVIFRNWN